MKKESSRIDELIKDALTDEEARFYDQLEEQNFLEKLGQVHKGKTGWLVTVMTIMHIVIFVVFVYCIFRFFDTNDPSELIKWASAGFLSMIFMVMMKLYIWMQMDKNDILREVKRLELQIAFLSNK